MLFTFKIFGLYLFIGFWSSSSTKLSKLFTCTLSAMITFLSGKTTFVTQMRLPCCYHIYIMFTYCKANDVFLKGFFLPKYALFEFQYGNAFKNNLASSKSSCGLQHYFKFSHGILKFFAHSPKKFFLQSDKHYCVFEVD